MADKELQMRLGAATTQSMNDKTLDYIHERLIEADDPIKIEVKGSFSFGVDEDDLLICDIVFKTGAIPMSVKRIRLKSDGNQLTLWKAKRAPKKKSAKTVDAEKRAAKRASAKKRVAAPEPKEPTEPKPRRAKKAGAKKKAKKKAAPKKQTAIPKKKRAKPSQSVAQRKAEIQKTNTKLYQSGAITREQAEAAGVDVEEVDERAEGTNGLDREAELALAEDLGGELGDLDDLDEDELEELEELFE